MCTHFISTIIKIFSKPIFIHTNAHLQPKLVCIWGKDQLLMFYKMILFREFLFYMYLSELTIVLRKKGNLPLSSSSWSDEFASKSKNEWYYCIIFSIQWWLHYFVLYFSKCRKVTTQLKVQGDYSSWKSLSKLINCKIIISQQVKIIL